MSKSIRAFPYPNNAAITSCQGFTNYFSYIPVGLFQAWTMKISNETSAVFNVRVEHAPVVSPTFVTPSLWTAFPVTLFNLPSSVGASATIDAVSIMEPNVYEYIRVMIDLTTTAVQPAVGTVKVWITGERK